MRNTCYQTTLTHAYSLKYACISRCIHTYKRTHTGSFPWRMRTHLVTTIDNALLLSIVSIISFTTFNLAFLVFIYEIFSLLHQNENLYFPTEPWRKYTHSCHLIVHSICDCLTQENCQKISPESDIKFISTESYSHFTSGSLSTTTYPPTPQSCIHRCLF